MKCIHSLCLALVLMTVFLITVPFAASAQDTYWIAIYGKDLHIPFSELITEDPSEAEYSGGEYSQQDFRVTIVQRPSDGELEVGPGGLVFRARGGVQPVYHPVDFEVSVQWASGGSETARGTIRVLPRRLPVIGDFFGDAQLEVGYYRPLRSDFVICPWPSEPALTLDQCAHYRVDGAAPGLPMTGAWSDTGYDGLGIYHPETGLIDVLSEAAPNESSLLIQRSLAGPIDAWPIAGVNATGFAFWRPQEQEIQWVTHDRGGPLRLLVNSSTGLPENLQPVIRRNGLEFGFFQPDANIVLWTEHLGPTATVPEVTIPWAPTGWLHAWIEDAFDRQWWMSFDPLISRMAVAHIVPYHGAPIVIDLPDDPD